MSTRIICEGCGQPVPIPEGYRRNKIQCPCGVICTVPESARKEAETAAKPRPTSAAKPARRVEEEAERWLLDDEPAAAAPSSPPRFTEPEPAEEPQPAAKPAVAEMKFNCRRCGRAVRRQGECPSCDADPSTTKEPVWWPSVDKESEEEEEGSSPYEVEGADEVQCPKCCFMLPPGSVLCVRCGFHLKKRKKIVKTYQPIEREWETNWARPKRLTLFTLALALALALGLWGEIWGGADAGVFVGSYLGFTAMMAFLLGTYDHIRLTRDARGRVQLVKTWRFCFIPRPPRTIDVRGFEGVVSGQHRDVSGWDYFIMFFLLISGIVPGLIWFYLAIYKVTFHVSLSRDHGYPEQLVYSGWDQMQMKEVAFALRDATGLRYDAG
jgi:hypothetical protein